MDSSPHSKKPTKLPVILSAFVCPGAGQFVQRRRIVGLLFFVLFIAMIGMFFRTLVGPLIANLEVAIDFANGEEGELAPLPILKALGYFGLTIIVYGLNVLDAWHGHMTELRKWHEAKARQAIQFDPKNGPPPLP